MKQHKTLNLNVKFKLSKIPSAKEKTNIIDALTYLLSNSEPHGGINGLSFGDNLKVDNYKVTIRKMGL